ARLHIERILTRLKVKVLNAATGAEALEVLAAHRDQIDAVLLDCRMGGGMSGPTTARRIRADEKVNGQRRRVPVIAYTGLPYQAIWSACEAAGMDGYLEKRCTAEDVSELLSTLNAESTKGKKAQKLRALEAGLPEYRPTDPMFDEAQLGGLTS